MKNSILYSILILLLLLTSQISQAQEGPGWTLGEMIEYATANNIGVKQSQLSSRSAEADYEQAKASRLPSLNASGTQTLTSGRSIDPVTSDFVTQDNYATNLSVNSQLTLFNGNRINNSIKQNRLLVESGRLDVEEAKNSIIIALTQAYLQALYNKEEVNIAGETVNTSAQQVERMQALFDAGSANAQELAQLKAQYANDQANLITAQNQYDAQILSLKQLLELDIQDDFQIVVPQLADEVNFTLVSKNEAYQKALRYLPEVKNSKLGIDIAGLDYAGAKAGYLPSLSLSGSVGTGYTSIQEYSYANQFNNNLYQRVGLTLSIPVFNQKATSTSVQKAKIAMESAKLEVTAAQKQVLQTIENTYQSVVASQSRLEAAKVQMEAAGESYRLADEKFKLGMLNLADFILEKTNYQSAQQAYLQAKYTALFNYQLLEFYQGNPIQL